MIRASKLRHRTSTLIAMAALAISLAASGSAYACHGIVGHRAAIYRYSNGTGWIKDKLPGEAVAGPGNDYEVWFAGNENPWIVVHVSERPDGYMDVNDLSETTCYNPWRL